MYCLVLSVVAPCRGPDPQVNLSMCMPHQMPMNLRGLIQAVSGNLFGSFKFNTKYEVSRPPGELAICIVRQGDWSGATALTAAPSAHGTSRALSRPWPRLSRIILP